jgi:hypothetical protein
VPQVRHVSDVPRAVFEALYGATPGGLPFRLVPLARAAEPIHRCGDMPAKPRLGPAEAPAPVVPSGARLARRDRSASAVATRVCVLHPFAATAPDPHLQDASGRRPSWIEATRQYDARCGWEWAERCSECDFDLIDRILYHNRA